MAVYAISRAAFSRVVAHTTTVALRPRFSLVLTQTCARGFLSFFAQTGPASSAFQVFDPDLCAGFSLVFRPDGPALLRIPGF